MTDQASTQTDVMAPVAPELPHAAAVSAAPPVVEAVPASGPAREAVTCPECGMAATIVANRRDASDFCQGCDYPLFWTPAVVLREESRRSVEDSLRRLPGTVGRATLAALPCPHCSEPNQLSAQVCVRCGRPMQIVEPEPPPAPVYVPPPLPEPEPEPEKGVPWWAWLLVALGVVAIIALIVLGHYGYLS